MLTANGIELQNAVKQYVNQLIALGYSYAEINHLVSYNVESAKNDVKAARIFKRNLGGNQNEN